MATRSPLGSNISCTLTVMGGCHDQLAHCEMCTAGFTTKWTPQYRRPQTKMEIRQQIRCPPDMSRGQRICCHIYTYNYMQYTTGAYRSRAHFPSQHELRPRTPPLDVLKTYSWPWRNTCVWCSLYALQISSKAAGSRKKTCTMKPLCVCDGRKA